MAQWKHSFLAPAGNWKITPNLNKLVQERVDLYQRFWSHSKNSQSCIIRFKNFRLHLKFLNLIIHPCSFFKQHVKDAKGSKRNRPQGGHAATPAVTSLRNLMNASQAPSSETQGQSVGSGEKARWQFSSTRLTVPGPLRVVWPALLSPPQWWLEYTF